MILQGRWAGPMNEELHEELQQERAEVQQDIQRRWWWRILQGWIWRGQHICWSVLEFQDPIRIISTASLQP